MAKKKSWYEIISPKVFGDKVVGETITDDPKSLIKRVVPVSGKELTGDIKKSHITVKLKIDSVSGDKAKTVIHSYIIQRQYLQRFIRKRYTTIEPIVDSKTEDGKKIRVKCVLTAPGRVKTEKRKDIRKRFVEELNKIISNAKLDNLIFLIIAGKLQHNLFKKIVSINPIRLIEIKKLELRN